MRAAFYAAEREYTPKKDRKMEEAAERAVAEVGGNTDGKGNNENDHDMRRLPIKRRMDITMKNKNEVDKLFSGENYRGAARREAIQHVPRGGGGGERGPCIAVPEPRPCVSIFVKK